MMKNFPRDWRIHGVSSQTPLLAGVLPRGGLHFLAGQQGNERDAVLADLSVAVASDAVTCGLSAADRSGARASLAGFFGQPAGAATGVAIITGGDRAEALFRVVHAAGLARGVSRGLPIAVLGGYSAEASGFRLHELNEWFAREHGVDIGLLIVDAPLPDREVIALSRDGRAVLCISDAPAGVADETVIIELGDARLTLAKPASGETTWSREFALDVVKVQGVETLVVRPGKAVEPSPIWKAAPVVARKVAAPPPELPIMSRLALVIHRGELSPDARLRLATQGFDEIVESQDAALPKPGQMVGGKREIVITGEDQLPSELKARATRLREEAIRLGVNDDIVINVAA